MGKILVRGTRDRREGVPLQSEQEANPIMQYVLIAAGIAALVLAFHFVWFEVLPRRMIGDGLGSPEICRRLERVAAMPSLLGESRKVTVRRALLRLQNHWGQPARALEHGNRILECRIDQALETDVRIRLADALETLGRMDEAQEQRRLAKAGREGEIETKDSTWYLNRGRALESERDFTGACEAYARSVEIMPPGNDGPRAFALIHLALAEFHEGRIEDSAKHAEASAKLATDPKIRHNALRQASAAYATMGQIEKSEQFDRQVCELARQQGDRKAEADSLAHLAENLRKRGRLKEALAAIEEARQIEDVRSIHSVRYEILRSSGRYEEALGALDASSQTGQFGLGRHETKLQAVLDFGASRMLLELGRMDEAEARLNRATKALTNDPKLHLWCVAAQARLEATRGARDEARALMGRVETGLPVFQGDRNTMQVGYANLGRAALALGDFERGLAAWQHYRDTKPSPVDEPTVLYHLGECHRGLGDLNAAREFYQRAVALGLETPESRLAAQRLEEPAA
jgi:tetratricopeptide (TPR) repeat protein